MILVDSNVLLDIFTADPDWLLWSQSALADALLDGPVVINQLVYAEVAVAVRRTCLADTGRGPLPQPNSSLCEPSRASRKVFASGLR